MASTRFFASLLIAAGASAHVQLPLFPPDYHAFQVHADSMKKEEYPLRPFVGIIPYSPYAMEVGVGTPPQKQSMVLSIGHSDSFVLYHELCEPEYTETPLNCTGGFFDEEKSATFDFIDDLNDTYYGFWAMEDVEGAMILETLTMDDAEMKNISLGVALRTEIPAALYGLGSPWGHPGGFVFEHRTALIDEMVDHGVIKSPSFSIWGEEKDNATGQILFGAIDKTKFDGKLQRFQASLARDELAPHASRFDDRERFSPGYLANVSAVWGSSGDEELTVWANTTRGGGSFYAAIDPTVTISILPEEVVDRLYQAVRPSIWHNVGLRTLPCNETDTLDTTFTLELGGEGGYRLNVAAKDLFVPAEQWHLLRIDDDDPTVQEQHCLFGVQSKRTHWQFLVENYGADTDWVIGNMLLKNTYVVFDGANMEVAMAPLKENLSGKVDIVAFESASAHAPGSDFVGYEECFKKGCTPRENDEDDEPDAGGQVVLEKSLLIGAILGTFALVTFG